MDAQWISAPLNAIALNVLFIHLRFLEILGQSALICLKLFLQRLSSTRTLLQR